MPAIGSNKYTEGKGNLILSKNGIVTISAGNIEILKDESIPWKGKNGSYAVGFYSKDKDKSSSIKILDNT